MNYSDLEGEESCVELCPVNINKWKGAFVILFWVELRQKKQNPTSINTFYGRFHQQIDDSKDQSKEKNLVLNEDDIINNDKTQKDLY